MVAEKKLPDLGHVIGGGDQYRHWLGMTYTEGVKYVADEVGAHWLIDAIASHQPRVRRTGCDPQFWELIPNKRDGSNPTGCKLVCRPDKDVKPVATQRIEYTDFPFDVIDGEPQPFRVWVVDRVMMLPQEY